MTSYQRRCDVITSHRRWYDVILTLSAHWEEDPAHLHSLNWTVFALSTYTTIFIDSISGHRRSMHWLIGACGVRILHKGRFCELCIKYSLNGAGYTWYIFCIFDTRDICKVWLLYLAHSEKGCSIKIQKSLFWANSFIIQFQAIFTERSATIKLWRYLARTWEQ